MMNNKSQENETLSLFSLLRKTYKVSHSNETLSLGRDQVPQDVVSVFRDLISPLKWRMFNYYMNCGASTVYTMRFNLMLKKARAYRNHKILENYGIVEPLSTVKPISPMKRPAQIWGLRDASEKQIKEAYQLHIKLISPRYRIAYMHVKKLDEYMYIEPSRRVIIDYLRDSGTSGKERSHIADIILLIQRERM